MTKLVVAIIGILIVWSIMFVLALTLVEKLMDRVSDLESKIKEIEDDRQD